MRLEWRTSMSIGDTVLDGQHRQLLRLLDGFHRAFEAGQFEAAEIAILEVEELTNLHFAAEKRLAAEGDIYASIRHVAARRDAEAHIGDLRRRVADGRNDERTVRDVTRLVLDIVIALFNHDSHIRERLRAPERRRFPRFPGNGLKAEIAGRRLDVVDISVNGMTVKAELPTPGALIVGLVPMINDTLRTDQRIEVSGTILRAADGISTVVFAPEDYEKMWGLVSRTWRIVK